MSEKRTRAQVLADKWQKVMDDRSRAVSSELRDIGVSFPYEDTIKHEGCEIKLKVDFGVCIDLVRKEGGPGIRKNLSELFGHVALCEKIPEIRKCVLAALESQEKLLEEKVAVLKRFQQQAISELETDLREPSLTGEI